MQQALNTEALASGHLTNDLVLTLHSEVVEGLVNEKYPLALKFLLDKNRSRPIRAEDTEWHLLMTENNPLYIRFCQVFIGRNIHHYQDIKYTSIRQGECDSEVECRGNGNTCWETVSWQAFAGDCVTCADCHERVTPLSAGCGDCFNSVPLNNRLAWCDGTNPIPDSPSRIQQVWRHKLDASPGDINFAWQWLIAHLENAAASQLQVQTSEQRALIETARLDSATWDKLAGMYHYDRVIPVC